MAIVKFIGGCILARALRRHHLIGDGAPTRKVGVGGVKVKSAAAAFGGACRLV